jgi:tetratricopeptide (TPR) repeat protein
MLGPLREYAKEKLGEDVELKKAHAEYYLMIAQRHNQKLRGAEQTVSLSLMALELDNVRAAMDFAQEQGEWRLSGELCLALSQFLDIRSLWSEGIQRLRQAEGGLRSLREDTLYAKVLSELGHFYRLQSDYKTAQELHTKSLQILRKTGDKLGMAISLNNLGTIARDQKAYDEAKQLFTESLQMRAELGNKRGIGVLLNQFGRLAKAEGDSQQALLFFLHAARLYEELEAADSKDAVEGQEALAGIQKEIGVQQFERLKQRAEAMDLEQVMELAMREC